MAGVAGGKGGWRQNVNMERTGVIGHAGLESVHTATVESERACIQQQRRKWVRVTEGRADEVGERGSPR